MDICLLKLEIMVLNCLTTVLWLSNNVIDYIFLWLQRWHHQSVKKGDNTHSVRWFQGWSALLYIKHLEVELWSKAGHFRMKGNKTCGHQIGVCTH